MRELSLDGKISRGHALFAGLWEGMSLGVEQGGRGARAVSDSDCH